MTGLLRLKSDKLLQWMELNDWRQQEMANALDCSPEYVSMLLSGKRFPSFETLEKLCIVTGLDIGTIMTFDRTAAVEAVKL